MSTKRGTVSQPGNPFKMTTVALLIVAIVMALVFSTGRMNREVEERERMDAAESEVAAVGLFLEEGDLPNAVIALHDVGLRLGRVSGAEDAALAVVEAVTARVSAHAATEDELRKARDDIAGLKERLAETDRLADFGRSRDRVLATERDRNALILRNAAEGRTALARRLLDATEEKDVVGIAAESLVARIEALTEAGTAAGAERVHRLRTLARTWPVEGVEAFAGVVGGEEERQLRAGKAIAETEAALSREDVTGTRDALVSALKAAGIPEVGKLIGGSFDLALRVGAARAEKEGRLADAAAAWRVAGKLGAAGELENRILQKAVIQEILAHAEGARASQDWFGAAGLFEAASRTSGAPELMKSANTCRASGWIALAGKLRKRGLLHAAVTVALEGAGLDPEAGEPVADSIFAEIEDKKVSDRISAAHQALADGNPVRAEELIEGIEVPPARELRDRIEAAKKEQALSRARVALHSGDGEAALDLLEKTGVDGPLAAEARLLAGDVAKGVAGLAGTEEEKTLVLVSAGWKVLTGDAARAARLGLAAVDTTGIRAGAVALLKAALAKAGDPPKGDELWDTVRATLFAADAGGMGAR
ncbi:MAG: hypothetical protein ABFS86_12475 [Planctomycetota bacterium]